MPMPLKIAVSLAVLALISGAVVLMLLRGPAILLDMAVSAAAFICL